MIDSIKPEIPESVLQKWQDLLNILAKAYDVPAALIMRVHESEIEVFLSNESKDNPYIPGSREHLGIGLYCETVMKEKTELLVPDALSDPKWQNNPDIKLGMTFYLGYPLLWPDNKPFGTICVLDKKGNPKAIDFKTLMIQFQECVNNDIKFIYSMLNNETELRSAMLKEAHHNIKNELQAVNALIKMEVAKQPGLREKLNSVYEKMDAVIDSYLFRTKNYDSKILFEELLNSLLETFTNKKEPIIFNRKITNDWYIEPKNILKVQLVINELITNALKHSKKEKTDVIIEVDENDEGSRIKIINSGFLPELFDFNSEKGLGNGLLIAKRILPTSGSIINYHQCENLVCAELLLSPPLLLTA